MEDLLLSAIRLTVPIGLLAVGEMIAERSGVLNLGIEGLLLSTALAAAVGAAAGGPTVGTVAAVGVGVAYNLVVAGLTVIGRLDQIVVGLALNLAALGATAFVFRSGFEQGQDFERIRPFSVPLLDDVPFVRVIFGQTWIVGVLLVMVAVLIWGLPRARWGLRLRAAGDEPAAIDAQGVDVARIRVSALMVAGALGGLAGCYLVLVETGRFVEGISGGRGFLAIAAVVLGGWRPLAVLGGAFLFGVGQALQFQLPASGIEVPTPLLLMLPYVLALIVVAMSPGRTAAPAALMQPFVRGRVV